MKNNIYCILGLSGTGKSSIIEEIRKRENIKVVVPCTTRPKRENEVHGQEYYYLNDEVFNIFKEEKKIVGISEYKVANGDVWKYGFNSLKLNDNQDIIIPCNPISFKKLKDEGFNVIGILVEVENKERLKRIFGRNDNQGVQEIIRRNKEDLETFKCFKADKIVFNNDLIENCVNEIEEIIRR